MRPTPRINISGIIPRGGTVKADINSRAVMPLVPQIKVTAPNLSPNNPTTYFPIAPPRNRKNSIPVT